MMGGWKCVWKKYVSGFTDSDICKWADVFDWPKRMAGLSIICLWGSVVLHESSLVFNPMSREVSVNTGLYVEKDQKNCGFYLLLELKSPISWDLTPWLPLDQWKELVFILKNTSLYRTVQPGPRCQHLHPGWPSSQSLGWEPTSSLQSMLFKILWRVTLSSLQLPKIANAGDKNTQKGRRWLCPYEHQHFIYKAEGLDLSFWCICQMQS